MTTDPETGRAAGSRAPLHAAMTRSEFLQSPTDPTKPHTAEHTNPNYRHPFGPANTCS